MLHGLICLFRYSIFTELDFPFTPSALLLSTAASTFDLFRAMYPISRASDLQRERSRRLQYSNDAKYLAEAAQSLRSRYDSVHFAKIEAVGTRFDETAERLSVVSASWLDDTIVSTIMSNFDPSTEIFTRTKKSKNSFG
jgi:hypothetical protein